MTVMSALSDRSADLRGARADAKAWLRSAPTAVIGCQRAAELLEQPSSELGGMAVAELLWATRNLGVMGAWRLLVKAGIVRESKPIGELTDRQRRALVAALREDS